MSACVKCAGALPVGAKFCPFCGLKNPTKERKRTYKGRGNGQGTAFKNGRGTWTAQATVGWYQGRRIRRTKSGFKTKKEALEYIPQLSGTHVTTDRDTTVSAIWAAMAPSWLDGLSENKANHYKRAYERLRPLWGAQITALIANDWQQIIDTLPGAYDPKKDAKIVVSKIYQYAIAQGWTTVNMAEHIRLPGQKEPTKDAFTREELRRLWAAWEAGTSWVAYVLIMCYTGMRPGELRSVRLEDVHLEDLYMVGGIKSAAGKRRMIGFPSWLAPVVSWAVEHGSRGKLLAISEENFYKKYNETLDAAGIVRTESHPMTPHCCRHTFVTEGTSAGIPLAMLQKMAGHSDPSVTAGYNHSHDPELLEQWQRLYRPF